MLSLIISFSLGCIIASGITYIIFSKNSLKSKEELIKLRAKIETSEDLQEIVKRDFVQLANETIKREQEDLRKQNRETLEEKILPLTKELGEFKENFSFKLFDVWEMSDWVDDSLDVFFDSFSFVSSSFDSLNEDDDCDSFDFFDWVDCFDSDDSLEEEIDDFSFFLSQSTFSNDLLDFTDCFDGQVPR